MHITVQPFTVQKRVPLTISRGTHAASTNLWVRLDAEGIEGWGEAVPFSIGTHQQSVTILQAELEQAAVLLAPYHPLERYAIEQVCRQIPISSATQAALDVALHDWLGKRTNLPLWQLWGLSLKTIQPTSVTIGISSPGAAVQRLQQWQQQLPIKAIKVKLGSPQGIQQDQAMFSAIREVLPQEIQVSVDANGGWALQDAQRMAEWLAQQGVSYLEQPLPVSEDMTALPELYHQSPLPIFVDESCFTSRDIPRLADRVHGINIKLMKAGGLSEAQRMIYTAKSFGLQVMFGCYSDSTLSNTALAHLSPLADHLDLDSHFNLLHDPFRGAEMDATGCLQPNNAPGLGLTYHVSDS